MSAFAAPLPLRAPRGGSPPVSRVRPPRVAPSAVRDTPPPSRTKRFVKGTPTKGVNNPFPVASVEEVSERATQINRDEEESTRAVRSRRVPAFRKLQRKHRAGPAANRQATEAAATRQRRTKRSLLRDGISLRELPVGVELRGVVQNLVRHGAYVDVGAVTDGLVHVREMSVDFVHSPREFVRTGDNVRVWVKYVNPVTNVLGLTMVKPKMGFEGRLKLTELEIGMRYEGVVERITNYGAYVDIGAERLGFLHVAAIWGRRPRQTLDNLRLGQPIWVHLDDVDEVQSHMKLRARGKGVHRLTEAGPLGDLADPADVADKDAPVVKSEVLKQRVLARPGEEEMYLELEDEEVESEEAFDEEGERYKGLDAFNVEDVDLTLPGMLSEEEIGHMFDGNTEFVGFASDEDEDEEDEE